jgi:hypothetical protein
MIGSRLLCSATFALALAAPASSPRAAVTVTVVDLPSRGYTQRFLHVRPDAPIGTLIALPGNDGNLAIQNDGSMSTTTARCNPVNRNTDAYAARGIAVALVDRSSDGTVYDYNDVLAVVRHVRARDDVPVWFIGGSNSTRGVLNMVVNLPADIPAGAIFFSPQLPAASILAQDVRPTMVVYHPLDDTQAGEDLYALLTAAPIRQIVALEGGTTLVCGYHLFSGLDAQFVAATAGFIENVTGVGPPTHTVPVVEYYHAGLDHYVITHDAGEIAALDAGTTIMGWARTGQSFNVYPRGTTGTSPVCRFYLPPAFGNSHFFGRGTAECTATAAANPAFVNEDPEFFDLVLPVAGVCPAGTRNVYRVFSNRPDANHRYMVDPAVRDAMAARQWLPEGDGPDRVVMCSPV